MKQFSPNLAAVIRFLKPAMELAATAIPELMVVAAAVIPKFMVVAAFALHAASTTCLGVARRQLGRQAGTTRIGATQMGAAGAVEGERIGGGGSVGAGRRRHHHCLCSGSTEREREELDSFRQANRKREGQFDHVAWLEIEKK